MTLPWIVGSAVAGVLAGPPLRVGVLARYGVKPPSFAVAVADGGPGLADALRGDARVHRHRHPQAA
jgi:hypothetical protein